MAQALLDVFVADLYVEEADLAPAARKKKNEEFFL